MIIRLLTRLFPFLNPRRRTLRFEILLPLRYNDGTLIEQEKFDQTAAELSDRFGGVAQDSVRVMGTWTHGGKEYRDQLLRMRVDTDESSARAYFQSVREVWKQRFNQIDIWITASEIEII
jgi:hypothetical protein